LRGVPIQTNMEGGYQRPSERYILVPAQREPSRPSERTIKRLFAVSGNRCAFRRCTATLIQGETVVGEICHINGVKPGSPRFDDRQTAAERHDFANLILMCGTHHTVIDDDEEAYTVERLVKLKAEHEKGAEAFPFEDDFVQHAAQLLLTQNIASSYQSGGITAHTVNADTINLHPPSISSSGGAPDLSIHDLFYYLRPNLRANGPSENRDEVGGEVLDKLSSGQLQAWGREIARGTTTTYYSLTPIARSYWRAARFTFVFLLEDHERDLHATQLAPSNLPDLADLWVNRDNAVQLWPHPVRESWNVQAFTLIAHYFNAPSDQVTVGCRKITLHDAHVEAKCDASGAPYQQVVAPPYILVSGTDPAFIRSLGWQAQVLSFTDPVSNVAQEFGLTGSVNLAAPAGRAMFHVNSPIAATQQPISLELRERATEFFVNRMSHIYAGIDAPVILRQGPRLILQVLPASALNSDRTIDHAAPPYLSRHFVPNGYELCDGRPRQEGWVWYQPPQPIEGLPNPVSWWHSRLDWNGFVEIVHTLDEVDEHGRVEIIRGCPLERQIVKTLDAISEAYERLAVRPPVFLRVELMGVLGAKLAMSTPGSSKGFDRPAVQTEVLGLSQMTRPLGRDLRRLLDALWRAAGWADGSPSYGRGDWDGYDNPYPYK